MIGQAIFHMLLPRRVGNYLTTLFLILYTLKVEADDFRLSLRISLYVLSCFFELRLVRTI